MKFWQDLRRRKVFRTAGLYVVGSWLVIQVADIFFPAWGIPETALRYLIIAAFACFPIALVFGWRYDVTARGIVRTEPAGEHDATDLRLGRSDYVILSALVAIGVAIILGSAEKITKEIEAAPGVSLEAGWRENSIAVLPFASLDVNPETQFFSDGITEEILFRLSGLGALHVLASNSSFSFRDGDESPAQIRRKLGVRYLLQGSIRRENDRVRVTARLTDEDGFQVWSESFERELEGIFAIQSEIASTVTSQIVDQIIPPQELPEARMTSNMDAYDAYLAGRALLDARSGGWRELAIRHFRRAIELDPGFAPPYATLAMTITVNTAPGPNLEEARQLVDQALRLDPELAEAHAARGLILMANGQVRQSTQSYRKALNLDPSLGFAYNGLSFALFRLGLGEEAIEVQQKGIAVDPFNPPLVANVAGSESAAGNFERAEQLLLRLISHPHPPPLAFGSLFNLYVEWGRLAEAVEAARRGARWGAVSGATDAFVYLAWGYGMLGLTEDADYWASLVRSIEQDDLATLDMALNLLVLRDADSPLGDELRQLVNESEFRAGENDPWTAAQFGLVHIQLGEFEKGSQQLDYGIRLYQAGPRATEPSSRIDVSEIAGSPDDVVYVMHHLAFAFRQVGRTDDADRILQELSDVFELENNAMHKAMTGDPRAALRLLQSADGRSWAKYYGPGRYYEIVNCPAWAETIKMPEFQPFLSEIRAEVARQRAIVEAVDAEHDFRAEIEALMATLPGRPVSGHVESPAKTSRAD